jgi:hypothetical protein
MKDNNSTIGYVILFGALAVGGILIYNKLKPHVETVKETKSFFDWFNF